MKGEKFHYNSVNQQKLFAVGLNGDEDLGQDITMKGQKFHYNQKVWALGGIKPITQWKNYKLMNLSL